MHEAPKRYRTLSSWLKETFGESVRKVALDAGLGCPNRDGTVGAAGCLYCNPRGSGTGALAGGLSISEQVDRGVAYLSRRYGCRKFIAYFQSFTNTYAAPNHLRGLYSEALRRDEMVGLAVGTRPDCVPDEILDLLAEVSRSRLVWVEYGLQSIHPRTLLCIRRGHSVEAFWDAVGRTRSRGLKVVAHLILGLPGESISDMVETARAVADADVDGVKLHALYVARGTGMEDLLLAGRYDPLTEEQAVDATLAVLETLPARMVIHRLTSDPHPEELVAPIWMLDAKGVRNRLQQAMERRNVVQGSKAADRGKYTPQPDPRILSPVKAK
jgi:uncharacterized protein